jgi:hypothetical protein
MCGNLKARSGGSVFRVGAGVWWLKAKHDVAFRHAGLFQFRRDTVLDPIFLHPDFAGNNFKMDDDRMHAPRLVPSFAQQQVAVGLVIEDGFGAECGVLFQIVHMSFQGLFDDSSIMLQFIHATTSSVIGSKTNLNARVAPGKRQRVVCDVMVQPSFSSAFLT